MNDIKNWKRTFLCGASLLLIAASPAMASGVDAMSTEGVAAVQQNGCNGSSHRCQRSR